MVNDFGLGIGLISSFFIRLDGQPECPHLDDSSSLAEPGGI
jgi:hypothetical protein